MTDTIERTQLPDGRGRPRKYDWPGMKVGDTFALPIDPIVLRASAFKYNRKFGTEIVVRADKYGARAWRLK